MDCFGGIDVSSSLGIDSEKGILEDSLVMCWFVGVGVEGDGLIGRLLMN